MKIVKEENEIKVIDFEVVVDSKIYNFIKELDYIEFANLMTFNPNEALYRHNNPDKNSYLRLNFKKEDFERLKFDFEEFMKFKRY